MQASVIRGFIFAAVPIFVGMVLSGCGGGGTTTTPTTTTTTITTVTTTLPPQCLCVFDVDRTLTGKQGKEAECPNAKIQTGITDTAYGGGIMMLSEVGQNIDKTFCGKCYHGIVSAGEASGGLSPERKVLLGVIGTNASLSSTWSDIFPHTGPETSSLVLGWPDGQKQNAVKLIVEWFMTEHNKYIPASMVHFFDDRADNVGPFEGTGFNAHQISCNSRDSSDQDVIGLCGAELSEIVEAKGITTCAKTQNVVV